MARRETVWIIAGIMALGCVPLGCRAPRGPFVVTDPDPANKIPGIRKAVRGKDLSAARQLVIDLDSDDPAVRFYAIQGLRRLAGQEFGYKYYDDELARQPAIGRWREWATEQE